MGNVKIDARALEGNKQNWTQRRAHTFTGPLCIELSLGRWPFSANFYSFLLFFFFFWKIEFLDSGWHSGEYALNGLGGKEQNRAGTFFPLNGQRPDTPSEWQTTL